MVYQQKNIHTNNTVNTDKIIIYIYLKSVIVVTTLFGVLAD